jgi:hypothetical protein
MTSLIFIIDCIYSTDSAKRVMVVGMSKRKTNLAPSVLPAGKQTAGIQLQCENQSLRLNNERMIPIHHQEEEAMAFSSPALSPREGSTEGCTPLRQEKVLTTERRWEKVLDDPILRRLLREGHRTSVHTDLLTQLEEDV